MLFCIKAQYLKLNRPIGQLCQYSLTLRWELMGQARIYFALNRPRSGQHPHQLRMPNRGSSRSAAIQDGNSENNFTVGKEL